MEIYIHIKNKNFNYDFKKLITIKMIKHKKYTLKLLNIKFIIIIRIIIYLFIYIKEKKM